MKSIFIYLTVPNEKIAIKISQILLKKRLIACANFFPIKSYYWWDKEIIHDSEAALILKTFKKNYQLIADEIRKIHPYKIPLLAQLETKVNDDYFIWMKEQIK